ncbi:MAG: hypothetical protein ACE5FI_19045, partial [Anaerolineales bacterium]
AKGATPSKSAAIIDEPTTTHKTGASTARNKLSRASSFGLRRSEYLAKRLTGAMFHDAGEHMGLVGDELAAWVHNGTQRTIGEFNKGMRPLYLEGDGTMVADTLAGLSTFQTYVTQKVLADLPIIMRASKPAGLTYLAGIATVGGAGAIPGLLPLLDYLVETVDTDGSFVHDWQQYQLDHKLMFRGGLSQLPVDISSRATFSGPFGAGSEYGADIRGVTSPFFNFVGGLMESGGSVVEGLKKLVPTDARNRAAALLSDEGKFTPVLGSKYHPTYDVNENDKLTTLLFGIEPKSVTDAKRVRRAEFAVANHIKDERHNLRELALRAMLEGDLTPARRRDITRKAHKAGIRVGAFWKGVQRTHKKRMQGAKPAVSRRDQHRVRFEQ